jgi:hypothetical protein
MSDGLSRRAALGRLAVLPVLPALPAVERVLAPTEVTPATPGAEVESGAAPEPAGPDGTVPAPARKPTFFTAAEYATVKVLVDDILPRDARSGSATDAGVPAFIDWTATDQPSLQVPLRGGLAWLNAECRRRFGAPYATLPVAQRHALLDDIAYPKRARPELSQGVAFFNRMRDLTASGFWSSATGHKDLGFTGAITTAWNGVPDAVLKHLGVSYEEWGK